VPDHDIALCARRRPIWLGAFDERAEWIGGDEVGAVLAAEQDGDAARNRTEAPDGKLRRFYVMRVIAGTEAGFLTREPADFHVLGSAEIKAARGKPKKGDHAKIGRAEATKYTLDALREVITQGYPLPAGVNESLIAQMLEDGYRLLDKLPTSETAEAAE